MAIQLNKRSKFTSVLIALISLNFQPSVFAGELPIQYNIAINEVFYKGDATEDWIELINRGDEAVDISGWLWCARFAYPTIEQSHILSGNDDLIIEPGEIIALAATIDLDDNASDLGLYLSGPFINPTLMVDFLQWGTSEDIGRPDIAARATIWLEITDGVYDFIPVSESNQSISWCGTESGGNPLFTTSLDFINNQQTLGTANNLSDCETIHIFRNGFEQE